MSSNNDRLRVLKGFQKPSSPHWSDRQIDEALLELRKEQENLHPGLVLDFYEPPLREFWTGDKSVKTPQGVVAVSVPTDDDGEEDAILDTGQENIRESLKIQAKLAELGAKMEFKVWIAAADRAKVRDLLPDRFRSALLADLPLNYEKLTLTTIELIDVLWMHGMWIARAFEVEHTTAIYSGLLRMADLIALQPNLDIRLHIVAPSERREKVAREIKRPVFSLMQRGPLSRMCTFLSYESIDALCGLKHLSQMKATIVDEYAEKFEQTLG